ncbi:MAG: type V CRISPR-associated protein Cas12b [Lacunisphaera sp.]
MPIVRIYQGRITRTEFSETGQDGLFTGDLTSIEHPLWQHHALFQKAINYYLVAIAALADTRQADVLTKLRERVIAEWDGGSRARGRVNGFGSSVAPLLGFTAKSAAETVFGAILPPTSQLTEARHLAGLLLLDKCQGDSGIQQGGRGYWPRFCDPDSNPTYDFASSSLAAAAGKDELATHVHDPAVSQGTLNTLAANMDLSWTVKVQPEKQFQGAEARDRLIEAVDHFLAVLTEPTEPRISDWSKSHEGGDLLATLRKQAAALPDSFQIPRNRKAAPGLTFATLLFKTFPSPKTAALLALHIKAPPKPDKSQTKTIVALPDFGRLGDDPIKLARAVTGIVFHAFTALPHWQPTSPNKPVWSEFDIAAFKEALKAVNQFRLKTEERTARKDKLQGQLDYQCARIAVRPKPDAATKDGDEAESLVRLGDDPRFQRLQDAVDSLAQSTENPEEGYTVSRASLRGWSDLRRDWLALRKTGTQESGPAAFDQAVTTWQAAHHDDAGDQRLFRELAKLENHIVWLPPEPIPDDTHDRAEDVLRAAALLFEDEEEIDQLATPVRLTPADPAVSPRQFMLTDLTGRHAAKHVASDQWEITAAARPNNSTTFSLVKLRLHFSAPRLHRDQLDSIGEATNPHWLPPVLTGLLGEAATQHAPTLTKDPALGLMPEFDDRSSTPRIRRILVNFPVSLDSDALSTRVGRAAHWRLQFNRIGRGAGETMLHLLWPGMKNAPTNNAWWLNPTGLTVLSIDLGQRTAAAAAVIELRSDGKFSAARKPLPFYLGRTGDHVWQAAVQTVRHLRLPGEDRALEAHEIIPGLKEERSGKSGRLASKEEWTDALELARAFGENEPVKRLGGLNQPDDYKRLSFPEHNDELLRIARSAANQLRRLHGLSWRIIHRDKSSEALTEIQADPELVGHLGADNAATASILADNFRHKRERYCALLERLANRVIPLREQRWTWIPRTDSPGQPWRQLVRVAAPSDEFSSPTKLAGQRGLSLSRVEQLEDLRRRFLSLNRFLEFTPGIQNLRAKRGERVPPEPCADLLEKIDRLKDQRINQTAHLILAEALGVRLRAHTASTADRIAGDIHGEYEPIPGRHPVNVIVMEDLSRYRSTQDRARNENRRLMQWSHRALIDKLRELTEPFGLSVVVVPAAYSSKFCARSGVVGFRAEEAHAAQLHDFEWRKLREREFQKKPRLGDDLLVRLANALSRLPTRKTKTGEIVPFTLLRPRAGGQIFVPLTGGGPSQADINAAINIGLRALAAPDCLHARPRWRVEFATDKSNRITLQPITPKEQRNKLETLFWNRAQLAWTDDLSSLASDGRKRTLLFHDPAKLAMFDRGMVALGTINYPVATSRGLFSAVKQKSWQRVFELNRARLAKAGLLTPELAELLTLPLATQSDNT